MSKEPEKEFEAVDLGKKLGELEEEFKVLEKRVDETLSALEQAGVVRRNE